MLGRGHTNTTKKLEGSPQKGMLARKIIYFEVDIQAGCGDFPHCWKEFWHPKYVARADQGEKAASCHFCLEK
jgi:hypothetical protein